MNSKDRDIVFKNLDAKLKRQFSSEQGVTIKTILNWKTGRGTIPQSAFERILDLTKTDLKILKPKYLPDLWHINEAARKGGLAHKLKYGNWGTIEGRKKGGLMSVKVNMNLYNGFKLARVIRPIEENSDLAEMCGILIGDGGMTKYQVIVSTNSSTDMEHALFVKRLFKKLFGLDAGIYFREKEKAVNIVVSSRNLVLFLQSKGIPNGNKFAKPLRVPPWIFKNKKFQGAFLKGLFDTDGCVYIDKKFFNGVKYVYPNVAITSYAPSLLKDLKKIINNLKLECTYKSSQKSVYLRGAELVNNFFSVVGSDNPKHLARFRQFMEEYRSGHNGAVSKTAVA